MPGQVRKQPRAVRLVLRLPGTSKHTPADAPHINMDSIAPLIFLSTRPKTVLETLKNILDEDEPLSENLPNNLVYEIDAKDALVNHGFQRIRFGRIEEAPGAYTEIYAYMAASNRQKGIPEIHFYGLQPHGSLKRYPLEDVILEGELDAQFRVVKYASSPAIVVLLQCLFILKGITMPSDCTISARFISEARKICYRFKNHRAKHIGDHARGYEHGQDESMTSLDRAPLIPAPQPDEGIDAANTATMTDHLITTTAHKRSHSSMCNQFSMVDGNSNSMRQAITSASLDPHNEYAQFTSLHEQKFNSKMGISNVDNFITTLLRGQHNQETTALVAAHEFDLQQLLKALKEKLDAELQAQRQRHLSEAAIQWQEPADGNTELVKKLRALHEEKSAKVQDLARIEADIERQREVLQSLPNMWEAIEGDIEDSIRKRMRLRGSEEGSASGED